MLTHTALPHAGLTLSAPEQGNGWLHTAQGWVRGLVHNSWAPYAVAAALLVLLAISIASRRKRGTAETAGKQALTRTDRLITRATGILATAVVATGAWKVFGLPALNLNPVIRVALFFFAEAQVIAAWRRVRRHIHRHAELGPGIRTIYGIALGSATVAAFDASALVEVLLRFFAAFVAAYMIAEELAEELDIHLTDNPHLRTEERRKHKRGLFGLKWSLTPERIFVWLRLAEPTERSIEDISRQARIARFARTAFRVHLLEETRAAKWRIRLAEWRLRRQTESGNEHLKLATDQSALGEVRAQLALLYGAKTGTSRTAVADLNPLRPAPRMAIASAAHTQDTATGHDQVATPDTASGQPADTAPDTTPVPPAPAGPDTTPDTTPDNAPDSALDNAPDSALDNATGHDPFTTVDIVTGRLEVAVSGHSPDMRPVNGNAVKAPADRTPKRATRRTPNPTPKWSKEQLKAFRLRDNRPDMTYPLIAREVGVSEKTVSRWFKARQDADAADNDPDSERAERVVPASLAMPIPEPKTFVTAGVNGHSLTPEEN